MKKEKVNKNNLKVFNLEEWVKLNSLIGETQGTLECAAIQFTEEQKHMVSPFRSLVERWQAFIEEVNLEKK